MEELPSSFISILSSVLASTSWAVTLILSSDLNTLASSKYVTLSSSPISGIWSVVSRYFSVDVRPAEFSRCQIRELWMGIRVGHSMIVGAVANG